MNYNGLISYVEHNIKANDNREITGNIMQQVLKAVINELGAGYQFAGIADDTTEPPTTDAKIFFVCGAGTYTNFGQGLEVPKGSIGILKYDSVWSLGTISIEFDTDSIADGAITEDKIGDGAITEDKIEDGAVSEDKLSQDLQSILSNLQSEGYKFRGVASLNETPATPNVSIFVIASQVGTYSGYNLSVAQSDGVCAFLYNVNAQNPAWSKLPLGIAFPPEVELVVESFSGAQLTAFAGHYYRKAEAAENLNIILPAVSDNTRTKSIMVHLVGGTTPNVQFSSADSKSIAYYDGFAIESGVEYELNIMFNGSKWIVAYGIIGNV